MIFSYRVRTNYSESCRQINYRSDIDGLRGVAVLAVVGFHAFPGRMVGGFIGVDIFFVISGFLISSLLLKNLENNDVGLINFYYRRVVRIFPALVVVLISCFIVGWLTLLPADFKLLGLHIAAGGAFISNMISWQESGYFDKLAILKPTLHLWSLGIEEQFYIIWPLVLWGAWKLKIQFLLIIFFIGIASFILNLKETQIDQVAAFYSPLTRCWELLIGGAIACWTVKSNCRADKNKCYQLASKFKITGLNQAHIKNWASIIGLILIISAIFLITNDKPFPGWRALLPTLGASLIILGGKSAWVNHFLLSNRWLILLGLISYPLYLWHWPILTFARIYEGAMPSAITRVSAVLVSVALAYVTYRAIEMPIRRIESKVIKTIGLVGMIFLVAIAGIAVYLEDGVIERFPKEIRNQIAFSTNDFMWYENVRRNICYLEEFNLEIYPKICNEVKKPVIALWGDSYAAALYPGFLKIQNELGGGVAEFASSACPPVLNYQTRRLNCQKINSQVLDILIQDPPNILILTSAWPATYPEGSRNYVEAFSKTIDKIKIALPKTKIIIIGPMPKWKDGGPSEAIFTSWKQLGGSGATIPIMLSATMFIEEDKDLATMAQAQGIKYISPNESLCDANQCISRLGNKSTDLMAVDFGHLSKTGSEFFVQKIIAEIINKKTKNY